MHPGEARNSVIPKITADTVLFLDDDCVADPSLLRTLHDLTNKHPEAQVFGGPNLTPPKSSNFQFVQGAVLASLIGAGPVRRRYGPHPAAIADERFFILCNLAIRREALVPFEDDLVCAEENRLLNALAKSGATMVYDPGMAVYHERRASFRGFASQLFKYGRGRGQVTTRVPSSVRALYLVPAFLLAYLALSIPLALITPWALAPLVLYLGALALNGAGVAVGVRRPGAFPLAVVLTAMVHICYGAGLYAGLVAPRTRVSSRPGRDLDEKELGVVTK
jgi:hypothetical protein